MSKRIAAALLAASMGVATLDAASAQLLTGTASYRLSLTEARGFAAIGELDGRLDASIDALSCDVYQTRADMEFEIVPIAGPSIVNTMSGRWIEGPETLEFQVEAGMDGVVMERAAGTATRTADGLSVGLTIPEEKTVQLTGDLVFPLEMVTRSIEAAKAGTKLFTLNVYDGSGNGEDVYTVTVLIGGEGVALPPGIESDIARGLGMEDMPRWPMTFGYFLPGSPADSSPAFTTESIVFDNGYVLEAGYDYGMFVAGVSLVSFEPSTPPVCPPN